MRRQSTTTNPYRGSLRQTAHNVARKTSRVPTRTRQLYVERALLNIEHLIREDVADYYVQAHVPEAWDTLERDIDVDEKKLRVTLRLDESVAKFYRAMGTGYQARINRILATFAQMRIAQVTRLEEMMEEELEKVDGMRG